MFFRFDNNKISATTFADKHLIDLSKENYILRLTVDGLGYIYYASDNDALWDYLKITGRTVDSLVTFIDKYVMMLMNGGIEFDWQNKTWHDLSLAVNEFKRSRPDAVTTISETKESETGVSLGDSRAERFNQLLT